MCAGWRISLGEKGQNVIINAVGGDNAKQADGHEVGMRRASCCTKSKKADDLLALRAVPTLVKLTWGEPVEEKCERSGK